VHADEQPHRHHQRHHPPLSCSAMAQRGPSRSPSKSSSSPSRSPSKSSSNVSGARRPTSSTDVPRAADGADVPRAADMHWTPPSTTTPSTRDRVGPGSPLAPRKNSAAVGDVAEPGPAAVYREQPAKPIQPKPGTRYFGLSVVELMSLPEHRDRDLPRIVVFLCEYLLTRASKVAEVRGALLRQHLPAFSQPTTHEFAGSSC
jgi:hypothetical protein